MELIFDWDDHKARLNRKDHQISFDEAKTIFNDPFLITFPDEFHSDTEERLISIGISANNRILLVVHTERKEVNHVIIIRIISARKATSTERKVYEENQA